VSKSFVECLSCGRLAVVDDLRVLAEQDGWVLSDHGIVGPWCAACAIAARMPVVVKRAMTAGRK